MKSEGVLVHVTGYAHVAALILHLDPTPHSLLHWCCAALICSVPRCCWGWVAVGAVAGAPLGRVYAVSLTHSQAHYTADQVCDTDALHNLCTHVCLPLDKLYALLLSYAMHTLRSAIDKRVRG